MRAQLTRNKVKVLSMLAVALVMGTQAGCGAVLSRMAKMMAPPAQATTSLTDIIVTGNLESNLAPVELGTISQSFFPGWQTGGDMLLLMFTKKGDTGFYRIDGTVTVNGKPAEFVTLGMYVAPSAADPSPRNVEITTKTGETTSFVMEPTKKQVKIVSINGAKDNVSLDLTKDVVIELEGKDLAPGAKLKVSLALNQIGVKSMYEVAYVDYAPKITLPPAAFRNINIKPAASLLFSYSSSFLSVAIDTPETATASGPIGKVAYTSAYSDGRFVTVTTEPKLNPGLSVKGEEAQMTYEMLKPGAFLSRPSEQVKKIGLLSLSIRGTTFHQSSKSTTSKSSSTTGNIKTTTTTTSTEITTLEFPKQTNETWDALLEDLYPAFMEVLTSEFNATEVPVDTVTGTDAYSSTVAFANDDKNTKVEFARSFRKTKVISASMPVSEGYGMNGVNERILQEAGADALATLTLDLQISEGDDGKILMTPRFAFELTGKANGITTNTKYVSGKIASSAGVHFTRAMTLGQLQAIVRKKDLLTVFRKGLRELRAEEKANGDYLTVWNLQK
jgi:hypothetical protein